MSRGDLQMAAVVVDQRLAKRRDVRCRHVDAEFFKLATLAFEYARDDALNDDICVTRDQFVEVFGNQSAAAGAPSSGVAPEAPVSSSASAGIADTLSTTTLSEFVPTISEASPTPESGYISG
jgi:hypothetical protein